MNNVVDFATARGRVTTGGSPPYDGDMEARVAKLEATAEHLQRDVAEIKTILRGHDGKFDGIRDRFDDLRDRMDRDFRLLFGALIAVALGLAGLMAKGFHWL